VNQLPLFPEPEKPHQSETPGNAAWRLILADNADEIAKAEAEYGATQAGMVEYFIENTCWSEDVPDLVGGNGTPREKARSSTGCLPAE
jgi:hypothetical protein